MSSTTWRSRPVRKRTSTSIRWTSALAAHASGRITASATSPTRSARKGTAMMPAPTPAPTISEVALQKPNRRSSMVRLPSKGRDLDVGDAPVGDRHLGAVPGEREQVAAVRDVEPATGDGEQRILVGETQHQEGLAPPVRAVGGGREQDTHDGRVVVGDRGAGGERERDRLAGSRERSRAEEASR